MRGDELQAFACAGDLLQGLQELVVGVELLRMMEVSMQRAFHTMQMHIFDAVTRVDNIMLVHGNREGNLDRSL